MKTATVLKGGLTALLDNPNIKPAESEYYKRKSEGISWGDYLYKKWSDFNATNQPINIIYNGELKEGQVVEVGYGIWQYKMPNESSWTSDVNHAAYQRGFQVWYDEMKSIADFETRIAYPVISVVGEKEQSKRKCVAGNFLCDACHYPKCDCSAIDAPNEVKEEGEYIICSAIWFNDGKEHENQPVNIKSGLVVSGRRHHNCYATLTAIAASIGLDERIRLLMEKTDRDKQGFITNTNRYVDRKEAYVIAKAANQIKFGAGLTDKENQILISENLY